MAREARETKAKKPINNQRNVKKEDTAPVIKTKSGEYIHHDLYDCNGWVTSCLGDDLKVIFETVDRSYFEHKRKISNGKIKRGSPFNFRIFRRVGSEIKEVVYIPGSTLGNKYRWKDDDDDDDDDDMRDSFGYYGDY